MSNFVKTRAPKATLGKWQGTEAAARGGSPRSQPHPDRDNYSYIYALTFKHMFTDLFLLLHSTLQRIFLGKEEMTHACTDTYISMN